MSTTEQTSTRRRQRHVVCGVDELKPGTTRLYAVGHRQIVVGHVPGHGYVALSNYCAHQGGPLSAGSFEAMWTAEKVGERSQDPDRWVLVCPYHNFEIDAATGCPVARLGTARTATYRVAVEADEIVVYV